MDGGQRLAAGHTLNLQDQVTGFQASAWPTPATRDHKGAPTETYEARGGETKGEALPAFVALLWQTPSVADTDGTRERRGGERSDELLLKGQASELSAWATPQARDAFPAHSPEYVAAKKAEGHGMRNLNDEASSYSLPAPATAQHGQPSPAPDPTSSRPQLNPAFVEWLMGWPPGWTSYACSATAWSHYRQRMRSAFLSINTTASAPARQLSIFGD